MRRLLLLALLLLAGCSTDPAAVAPPATPPERTFHFEVDPVTAYATATVEGRTADSTYRMTTNAAGSAQLSIDNAVPLPARLFFTADGLVSLPGAALSATVPGQDVTVRIHCPSRPSSVLVRGAQLVRLGDGIPDGASDDFQLGAPVHEVSYNFGLLAIPKRMPSYRVSARGLESYVEVRVNGILVNRFRPPADPSTLSVQADTLLGLPSSVFQLTQNVLTIRTAGLGSNAANLDDVEIGAVSLYFP